MTDKNPPNTALRAEQSIRALRRKRARYLALKLGAFVVTPTLAAAVYFGLLASDSYQSVAMFSIQASESKPTFGMESLMGIAGVSSAGQGTLAARDYVLSREMMNVLNGQVQLLDHYRSKKIDYFSRLPRSDSVEDAFEYYLERVGLSFDSNSGVLTLKVNAYESEQAYNIASAILLQCEKKVNLLSEKVRLDQIRVAEQDLEKAEKRLGQSREQLVALQQELGDLSPEQTAQAALTIRTELESEVARARAEYAVLKSYMAETSPAVIAARERVNSLSAQAHGETKRLVNSKNNAGLNNSLVEFEKVMVEKEFATHAYQSALSSLELARAEAARQHRYLAVIAAPSHPDEAMFPRRWLMVFTTFVTSLILFGIGSLGFAAVKEHARL